MINHIKNIKDIVMSSPEVKEAKMKALVGPEEGWDGYVMRLVEVGPYGYTPKHQHPWPHINYMVEGDGEVFLDGEVYPVTEGSFAYIEVNKLHQFKNTTNKTFKFICIVPKEGHIV
jgi:quercetin dioxygenase-like cupin family protein